MYCINLLNKTGINHMHTVQKTQTIQAQSLSTISTKPPTDSEHKRFIRLTEVINLTGLCRASVYHYIKRGDFPAPAKFGKSSLWEYHEIQAWINKRLQERDNQAS